MSPWIERILKEFPADLSRLWIAADPDDVLLDEQVLSGLRERGFEVLPFEDSVAFRAEYECRYRSPWARGEAGAANAVVLQWRGASLDELPWDYLAEGRQVRLALADLFPKLSYSVVQQLGPEHHEALYAAQQRHTTQALGESATKDFVLTHLFKLSPHLIGRTEDLWQALLRLHYRDAALPPVLTSHVAQVLREVPTFTTLPLELLFASKAAMLRVAQAAWYRHLGSLGVVGNRVTDTSVPGIDAGIEVPFEHPDVRVIVDSMFLEGLLQPLIVSSLPPRVPEWAKVGMVADPLALRHLVRDGIEGLRQALPGPTATVRDWMVTARRLAELLARFHALDLERAQGLGADLADLQRSADRALQHWVREHFADLPSLPASKAPVMVHHIARHLALRRGAGEKRVALLVFDGLALDQWVLIRDTLNRRAPRLGFEEGVCVAWAPTLTSVSRQAIFSGMKPRDFSASIETTSAEPAHWARFWQDQGLRAHEVAYRKGLQRLEDLPDVQANASNPAIKALGLVVDTVDAMIHGAVMGKRGICTQLVAWLETGFVEALLQTLLDQGFAVYMTGDHGNVDATGCGRPQQGVAAEMRGERVRTYRQSALADESAAAVSAGAYRLDLAGLPPDFHALYTTDRGAFLPDGVQAVVHGGISVEELLVPFVRVSYAS